MRERRLSNGLFFWKNSYESGIDNSPRFTNRSESKRRETKEIAAIDFSSFVALSAYNLSLIANEISDYKMAEHFRNDEETISKLIDEKLWNGGMYFDLITTSNQFIEIDTLANYLPLMLPSINKDRKDVLIKRLVDPKKYNTVIPFPSVARDETSEHFQKDCWRGPVWINLAYLMIESMNELGERSSARVMANKLVSGVYETWRLHGSFYEFYDPDHAGLKDLSRKKGNWFKQLTLGNKPVSGFVGWTGLVNNLVLNYKLGQ